MWFGSRLPIYKQSSYRLRCWLRSVRQRSQGILNRPRMLGPDGKSLRFVSLVVAMFESLQDGLKAAFKSLRGKGKLTESNMRDGLRLVETSLLEADVSYSVVKDFMGEVTEKAMG